jgi:uncharacterized protein (DUF1330 family)
MSAYVVVQVEVQDQTTYDEYRKMVQATIDAYGGKLIVRGGNAQTLEGTWKPARLVILEFASVEQANRWWSSAEYAPAKALRQKSAKTEMIVVEGV